MPSLPTTTWGTESDANRIKKTYVKGFMDVSGGELSVHNTAFNIFNSDGSGVFRINPRKITVNDDTGQEVDISLSYLTFLNVLVPPDGQAVSIPEKVKYIFTVGKETNIGKSDASSNFRVYGNTYVEQNLFVNMDASFGQRFLLSGDASLNSNLYVKSKTRLDNDLSLNGSFTMYGDASLNGRLMLSGDASFNGNLYVLSKTRLGNDLSLNGNFTMYGDASINGLLLVSKDASLNGNVYVRGRTTFYEPSGSVITDGNSRGTLNLTHGDASGGSSILFQSVNSANNDYAYIQYQENVPYVGQTSIESGLLTIGIENEITGGNRDRISLWAANGSGFVGINTKFPNYNLDVSGQMRICEGTGTIASATSGSMILEHTAVGGTSSIMFKGPNSTTNDYAYIQYEDNTAYTLPVLKYDFTTDVTSILSSGVPSTGSYTIAIRKNQSDMSIISVSVSNVGGTIPVQLSALNLYCISFNQYNLSSNNISDYIHYTQLTGNVNPFSSGFTFSAWIRPSIVAATNCRFYLLNISLSGTSPASFDIYIDGDNGRIVAICGEDSTNYKSTNVLTVNTWYHYAFTFDNATSTGNHYLNGVLVTGGDAGTTYSGKQLTATNQAILIGLKWGYNLGGQIGTTGKFGKGFHGYLNYINMFDRALSITDIAVLYNTPGYTQSTINRGLMTFGIENEPGAVFNDRIALMPANGSGFVGINTKTPAHTLSLGQLNADCKLALYDDGTGSNWYGIGANNYNLTFGAAVGTANQNEPQMKLSNTGSLDIKNSLSIGRNNTITVTPAPNPKIEIGNGGGISRWKIEDVVLNRDNGGAPTYFDYGVQSKLIFSAKSNNLYNNTANDLAYINGMTLVPNSGGNGALSTGVNVGIGTTNPTYTLDVSGTIQVKSGTSEANPSLTIIKDTGLAVDFCAGGANDWQHRSQLQIQDVRGNSMVLAVSTDGVGIIQGKQLGDGNYRHISINPHSAGNVGIGTRAPAFKLDVNGTLRAGATTITGTTNINTTGSSATNIGCAGTTTTFAGTVNGLLKDMVGLGNVTNESKSTMFTNPTFTGTVKGPTPAADDQYELATTNWVIAKGYSTGVGSDPIFNTVTAVSFNAGSDYRIKTDVKPLNASFNIDVLKPVTYTNTRHGRQDVGFIAHEVQEHYPFLVNGEKDGEQMQSLNYIGLIGILTKEIQDLKRRLAETEAKVASVETDIRTIETKVEEVGDIIISVEDKVLNVENTVLLEQARLTICETEIALNKSAIKDLDERLQS